MFPFIALAILSLDEGILFLLKCSFIEMFIFFIKDTHVLDFFYYLFHVEVNTRW